MTWVDMEDIVDVDMMLAGPPGTGITGPEKAGFDARLDALESADLGDHDDTNFTNLQEGQGIVRVGGQWVNQAITQGLALVTGQERDGADLIEVAPATELHFAYGLDVEEFEPGKIGVYPRLGVGAGRIAEGNHLHPVPVETRHVLSNPGSVPVITSGVTELVSVTLGTFAVDVPTKVDVMAYLHGEGVNDPGQFDIELLIDGVQTSTADIPSTQKPTFEQGVNGLWTFRATRVITRTGAQSGSRTIAYRVRWRDWGGVKVHAAWMDVVRTAYRNV